MRLRHRSVRCAGLFRAGGVTRVRPLAGGILSLLGGVLPRNYRERIHTNLVHAGVAHQFRAEEIISLQVLGGIIGFLLGAWIVGGGVIGGGTGLLVLVLLPVIGVYAPKSWLDRKVQERKDSIRRDLPDTLDLLAISVEAGMGFEGALGVV